MTKQSHLNYPPLYVGTYSILIFIATTWPTAELDGILHMRQIWTTGISENIDGFKLKHWFDWLASPYWQHDKTDSALEGLIHRTFELLRDSTPRKVLDWFDAQAYLSRVPSCWCCGLKYRMGICIVNQESNRAPQYFRSLQPFDLDLTWSHLEIRVFLSLKALCLMFVTNIFIRSFGLPARENKFHILRAMSSCLVWRACSKTGFKAFSSILLRFPKIAVRRWCREITEGTKSFSGHAISLEGSWYSPKREQLGQSYAVDFIRVFFDCLRYRWEQWGNDFVPWSPWNKST